MGLNAIDEGLLGAWYYERDLCEVLAVASCTSRHTYAVSDREFYESGEISRWYIVEVGGLGLKLGARISWGDVDVLDVGRLSKPPSEGVLSAAVSEHENA